MRRMAGAGAGAEEDMWVVTVAAMSVMWVRVKVAGRN